MSWNASYTRQKQKEMTEKAIAEDKKNPIYPSTYEGWTTGSSWEKERLRRQHDKFCWRVGYCILAIITGLFIWLLFNIL